MCQSKNSGHFSGCVCVIASFLYSCWLLFLLTFIMKKSDFPSAKLCFERSTPQHTHTHTMQISLLLSLVSVKSTNYAYGFVLFVECQHFHSDISFELSNCMQTWIFSGRRWDYNRFSLVMVIWDRNKQKTEQRRK